MGRPAREPRQTQRITARPGRVLAFLGAGLILSGLIAAGLIYKDRARLSATAAADAEGRRIAGPPCPTLTPAAFAAQPYRPAKTFNYDDMEIARVSGHVTCNQVSGGLSCQFTSPNILVVTTRAGEAIFQPGLGRAATIQMRDGQPRCMLAARFTLDASD